MLVFKKSEFLWGEFTGIVNYDFFEFEYKNWWDSPLIGSTVILQIKNKDSIRIFNSNSELAYIPRDTDYEDPNYDTFWESEETVVFACMDYAINYIENYEGDFEVELKEYYNSVKDTVEFYFLRDIW